MTTDDEIRERLRAARAKYAEPEPDPGPAFDPSLIPTEDLLGPRRLDSDLTKLKERIDREVTVFDIYDRFMPPHKVRAAPRAGQRESIKFSCPDPSHPDAHPSAWTNIDGLWYCEPCGARGDKYTIAAIGEGLDIKRQFPEVCKRIADAFGIRYDRTPPSLRIPVVTEPLTLADILPVPETRELPLLDYKKLFPVGTFIRTFIDATAHDDLPMEFYLWESLLAVGLAIGRDCGLRDFPFVYGNLYLCLYGPSGIGKSRAMKALFDVLRLALHYEEADDQFATDPPSKGTKILGNLGSPEAIVDSFCSKVRGDPMNPGLVTGYASVRGLAHVDELQSLISRGDRTGGLKSQFTTMYDSDFVQISSRGHKNVRAEGIFCSLLTSTQPQVVGDYLRQADLLSGFANRFIFVMGHLKTLLAIRESGFDATKSADLLKSIQTWATFNHVVDFDGPGRELYKSFFESTLMPLKTSEISLPLFTRIDLTIKKIILLMCANEKSIWATADIVERAISFFDYLKFTYEELGGSVTSSSEAAMVKWLEETITKFVSKNGHGPTERELQRQMPSRFTPRDLEESLARQGRFGNIIGEEQKGKAGRPTVRYRLASMFKDD